ncbi:hypothetical protein XELAEV_18047284mg [Xenopus laevis]|uniref:Uncharacterized protein n=1 Tax=Xenopus laevis TaxID=8355 RepID=A0A974BVL1_XENLA|nr:hypothetical protein XELAEV_18047284mg [Xenopus laevis]
MIPSVQRLYDFQSGRSFSWPPTSQKWQLMPFAAPLLSRIRSVLKPIVGTVFTNSLNLRRYSTVVFPAESKPSITMCSDWKEEMLEEMLPMFRQQGKMLASLPCPPRACPDGASCGAVLSLQGSQFLVWR